MTAVYTDWTAVSMKGPSGRGLSIRAESARLTIVELVVFSSPGFFHRAAVSWPSYQMSMALIGTRSFSQAWVDLLSSRTANQTRCT